MSDKPDVQPWMEAAAKALDEEEHGGARPSTVAIIAKHYAAREVPPLTLEDLPRVMPDLTEKLRGLGLKIVQIEPKPKVTRRRLRGPHGGSNRRGKGYGW